MHVICLEENNQLMQVDTRSSTGIPSRMRGLVGWRKIFI